jgi:ketosteroid isomerase-like protein
MSAPRSSEDLLATLAAERSIRRLISAYCDAVARRDAEALRPLYTPDCVIEIADRPPRVGIEAQVEGLRQTFAQLAFLHQRCDANLIDVTGDTARARVSVFETNRHADADTMNMMFGTYEDQYAKLPDGWRFKHRKFTIRYFGAVPIKTIFDMPDLVPAFPVSLA